MAKPNVKSWAMASGGTIVALGESLPELMAEFQGFRQKGEDINEQTGESRPRFVYDFVLYEDMDIEGRKVCEGEQVSLWGMKALEPLQTVLSNGLAPCPVRMSWHGKISIKGGAQQYNDIRMDLPSDIAQELAARKNDSLPLAD